VQCCIIRSECGYVGLYACYSHAFGFIRGMWTFACTASLMNVTDAEQSSDCEGRTSIKAWGEHLHGAAKLIEFRGPEQFRTKNAFSLLRHLRCLLASKIPFRQLLGNADNKCSSSFAVFKPDPKPHINFTSGLNGPRHFKQ
jgi:hypothetical protein